MEAEPAASAAVSVLGPGPAPGSRAVSATGSEPFRQEGTYPGPQPAEDGEYLLGAARVDRQRVPGEPGSRGGRRGRIGEHLARVGVERRIVEVARGDAVPRERVDGGVTVGDQQ